MISIPLWQHEWEEEVEDDVTIIQGLPGDVGHEPVPELSQRPEQAADLMMWQLAETWSRCDG